MKIHTAIHRAATASTSATHPLTLTPGGGGGSISSCGGGQRACQRFRGTSSADSSTLARAVGLRSVFGARFGDQLFDLGHERGAVVGNAVLDGPLDAAGAHGLAVLDVVDTRGVQHLQVLEWVAVHDDEIRLEPLPHATELGLLAEDARVVEGRVLDDLDRVEARLLVQLELAQEAESVHLINEPGVVARP